MATQNRDVRLTIRAKDETSRVIAKVKESLNQFGVGADKLSKNNDVLGSKFKHLATEIGSLQSTLAKTKGQLSVNTQYNAVSQSLSKLSQEYVENTAAIARNSKELADAKTQLQDYTNKRDMLKGRLSEEKRELDNATRAVERHTKSLAQSKGAVDALEREYADKDARLKSSRAELERLTEAQSRAAANDHKAASSAERLAERLARLREERRQTQATLTGRQGLAAVTDRAARASARRPEDQGLRMVEMRAGAAEGDARNRLMGFDQEIARLTTLQTRAAEARASTSAALGAIRSQVRGVEGEIRKVGDIDALGQKLAKNRQAVATHSTALNKAQSDVTRLAESTSQTGLALQDMTGHVVTSNNQVQRLAGEANRLDKALASNKESSAAVSASLKEMESSAKAGGLKNLTTQAEVLERQLRRLEERIERAADKSQRLGRYADGAGNFTGSADAAQLRGLNAQLSQAKADATVFREEINRLNAAINNGTGGRKQMRDEMARIGQALRAAEADARKFSTEIREVGIRAGSTRPMLGDMWRQHNNETRTALNLYQRVRGQVLSMIAAYGGLYGVVRVIQSVTQAYMSQEAALSRLGVVFGGNSTRMVTELGWIRREAARLGIEMGGLANEYTKFAVAAKTSGFADDSIRRIFTSVSESARVNKLGMEDIKGVYLALTQMISKGKISAEELRQQMGERLPGAMKLMADAFGVTIAELDDMMKKGQALSSEENMLRFAEKLEEVFGGQLPQALKTFTTEWGRLQNTIYQANVTMGKGGFMDALTDVMRQLNEYANSKEGVDFFLSLGSAMGDVARWVPTLIENFEKIVKVVKILVTIGLAKMFTSWWLSLGTLTSAIGGSIAALGGFRVAFGAMIATVGTGTVTMGAASAAAMTLGRALFALGPIVAGLAAAGVIFSTLGSWSDGVDKIVSAQAQHQRIMDQILTQYDEAKGKTYDWRDAISEKNRAELASQLPDMLDAFGTAYNRTQNVLRGHGPDSTTFSRIFMPGGMDIDRAVDRGRVRSSETLAERFKIDPALAAEVRKQWQTLARDLNKATDAELKSFVTNLRSMSSQIPDVEIKNSFEQMAKSVETFLQTGNDTSLHITAMRELGHAVDDTQNITERFKTSIKDAADGTNEAADAAAEAEAKYLKYKEAMDGLNERIPSVSKHLEYLNKLAEIDALEKQGIAAATSWSELVKVLEAARLAKEGLDAEMMKDIDYTGAFASARFSGDPNAPMPGGLGINQAQTAELVQSIAKVAAELGVSARDILSAISFETGGTFDPWKAGPTTKWGQHRGLIQWGEPQRAKYGVTESSSITQQAEAIGRYLRDTGVKSGDGLEAIYAAILAGDARKTNASDLAAGGVVGSVKNSVAGPQFAGHIRKADGLINAYAGNIKETEEAVRLREREAEAAKKLEESRQKDNEGLQNSITFQNMRNQGQEREAFIQEQLTQWQQKYGEQSAEETARLRERFGLLYDAQNFKTQEVQTQEKAKELQEQINRLETERNALIEQREYYQSQGDTTKVEEIDGKLKTINAELEAAIQNFIAFWQASGSPEASSAIASLEAMQLKIKDTGKAAILTADQINNKLADGIGNAFSAFAEAIANGENALDAFKNAFLRFAAEFLIEIGKMIVKQTLLNMLQGAGGAGGVGGGILGMLGKVTTGIFHTGKGPGSSMGSNTRSVSPAMFMNAPRFHQGKLPGLRQNEMAAIIEEDEEVITTSDPRHSWNMESTRPANAGGTAEGGDAGMTVVNAFDAESFLEAALDTPRGRKLFTNFVSANKSILKGVLS